MLGLAPADFDLLFLAGFIGSAVNAVAGGGTFFTFPAFLSTGIARDDARAVADRRQGHAQLNASKTSW